jgi:hypothetical protein
VMLASFDVQEPGRPVLVGASGALPAGPEAERDLNAFLARQKDPGSSVKSNLAVGLDSMRIEAATEREDGVARKRVYVAGGMGAVARFNLDEQNGLNQLGQARAAGAVSDVAKAGHLLYASHALPVPANCEVGKFACEHCETEGSGASTVSVVGYMDLQDPLALPAFQGANGDPVTGANALTVDGRWLYAGGIRRWTLWNAAGDCRNMSGTTNGSAPAGAPTSLTAVDILDPFARYEVPFSDNIRDVITYGRYLIVALGPSGVEILHRDNPAARARVLVGPPVQEAQGAVERLMRAGNLVFASAAGGGVLVIDVAEPMQPRIVSAGAGVGVLASDYFKGRLITVQQAAASSGAGQAKAPDGSMSVLELPGSFVAATSVEEGGLLMADDAYELTFNEFVTVASVTEPDAVHVERVDTG